MRSADDPCLMVEVPQWENENLYHRMIHHGDMESTEDLGQSIHWPGHVQCERWRRLINVVHPKQMLLRVLCAFVVAGKPSKNGTMPHPSPVGGLVLIPLWARMSETQLDEVVDPSGSWILGRRAEPKRMRPPLPLR